jgi:hypothetical protein
VDSSTDKHPSPAAGSRHHGSPEGKIVGAFTPAALAKLIPALAQDGHAEDQIDVVTAEDLPHLNAPVDRQGFAGAISRFLFSLGGETDELERMREELRSGHVLVGVPVRDEATTHRVHDVMREHGGHGIVSYGRWTITPFEER